MTDFKKEVNYKLAYKAGVYNQPRFRSVPTEQNANNTRYPIQHLSHPYTIRRFNESPINDASTGRIDQGVPTELTAYMNIQPTNGQEDILLAEGRRVESVYEFWLDPYNPKHIELYDEPFYLKEADSRYIAGGDGFNSDINHWSDHILFNGEWYEIVRLKYFQASSNEEENEQRAGHQEGLIRLIRDEFHERDATKENNNYLFES